MRTRTHAFTTASSLCLAFAALAGGPLTPPAGPPTETPGPEPRTAVNDLPGNLSAQHVISEPGNYWFNGYILGDGSGRHGVLITTPGPVVIDGMGFSMIGAAGSGDAFHILDDTNEPMRWEIRNVYPVKWEGAVDRSSGPGDTAPNDHNVGVLSRFDWGQDNTGKPAINWEGDLIVTRTHGRGGGIYNSGGTLTITNSTITGNEAVGGTALPAIEADGLTMRNVEVRKGEGVKAHKPREIVVVGSKVKEVVRAVALELAEGAVVTDTEVDGTVDALDYAIWRRNRVVMDFNDVDMVAATFGAGSEIADGFFLMLGPLDAGEHAIEVSEEVAFFYNKISFSYSGSSSPPALVLFNGGGSSIVGNLVRGVPAGAAGFAVYGILNTVRDNEFHGAGLSSTAIIGGASRSVFRNNTMMNFGAPFDLTGTLNFIGPEVDSMSAYSNVNPDRNLEIPALDPVR